MSYSQDEIEDQATRAEEAGDRPHDTTVARWEAVYEFDWEDADGYIATSYRQCGYNDNDEFVEKREPFKIRGGVASSDDVRIELQNHRPGNGNKSSNQLVDGIFYGQQKLPSETKKRLKRAVGNFQKLKTLKPGSTIDIAEGTRDCRTLSDAGFNATTFPFGARKTLLVPEQLEFFRGHHVRIWEDDDSPGRLHAIMLVVALQDVALSVEIVSFANHPLNAKPDRGFDVSDWKATFEPDKWTNGHFGSLLRDHSHRPPILAAIDGPAFIDVPHGVDLLERGMAATDEVFVFDKAPVSVKFTKVPQFGGEPELIPAPVVLSALQAKTYFVRDDLIQFVRLKAIKTPKRRKNPETGEMENVTRADGSTVHNVKWEYAKTDCPKEWIEILLSREGDYDALPPLAVVRQNPLVLSRMDDVGGKLEPVLHVVYEHGFHKPSGTYVYRPPAVDKIAGNDLTLESARAAAKRLLSYASEISFDGPVSRAVWFSKVLTLVARPAMDKSPVFSTSAPSPRIGKSASDKSAVAMATGKLPSAQGTTKSRIELDKRIETSLRSARDYVYLDNLDCMVSSDVLAQSTTENDLEFRVLGESRSFKFVNSHVFMVNGNNVEFSGAIAQRVLETRLETDLDNPGERVFKRTEDELYRQIRDNRPSILRDILIVLLSYNRVRMQGNGVKLDPLNGFVLWTKIVREAVVWLHETDESLGLADPGKSMKELSLSNPVTGFRTIILNSLFDGIEKETVDGFLQTKPFTAANVIDLFNGDGRLTKGQEYRDRGREAWIGLLDPDGEMNAEDAFRSTAMGKRLQSKLKGVTAGGKRFFAKRDPVTNTNSYIVRSLATVEGHVQDGDVDGLVAAKQSGVSA